MKIRPFLLGAFVAICGPAVASVDTVYSNPYDNSGNVNCSFSTSCATQFNKGDDYAAQQFTLSKANVIVGASFTDLEFGAGPSDVNWAFIRADGAGGLPGTILASGTDNFTSSSALGGGAVQNFFDVGTVALDAGTYYLAFKADSSNIANYLGQGVQQSGAAETHDGGATWAAGYESQPSVAVAVFAVPEPATWALMMIGFAGVGGALRRRSRSIAAA